MDSIEFLLAAAALGAVTAVLLSAIAGASAQAATASNHSLSRLAADNACFASAMLSSSGDGTALSAGVNANCSSFENGFVPADGELG